MNEPQQSSKHEAGTYLPFVRKIASRVARRLPHTVEMDDLISAGTVGLMEAIERYSPDGGRPFETYAEFRIKGAMLDELRRNDPLNRAARNAQNAIAKKTAELTSEYGRPPDAHEMAAALNTTVENVAGKLSMMKALRVVSMDADSMERESDEMNQEEVLERMEVVEIVRQALAHLPERQQIILNLYYVEELTQAQIGQVLKISESRVCQVLTECIKRLRKNLEEKQV